MEQLKICNNVRCTHRTYDSFIEMSLELKPENDYQRLSEKYNIIKKWYKPLCDDELNWACMWYYNHFTDVITIHEKYLGQMSRILNTFLDKDVISVILKYIPLLYQRLK